MTRHDRPHPVPARSGIRPARRTDLPTLLAIQTTLDRATPDLLRDALDGVGTVLVSTAPAGDRRRPVGYLLSIPGNDAAFVAELAVAPSRRREGRASALLDAAWAGSGADRQRLAVAPDNEAARQCYRAAGFRVTGSDPDYFDGRPAVFVERSRSGGE